MAKDVGYAVSKLIRFGATEQNLLKLFEWIVSESNNQILKLPAINNKQEKIIY